MKVVIVGAGVAGLGIGWRLAQQGAQVTILDRAQPGMGASWAAAGMIAPVGELAGAPPEEIAFAKQARDLWPGFATALEAESGVNIGFHADGALFVADDSASLAAQAVAMGSAVERLDAEAARAHAPLLAPDIAGALWAPNEARVDNRALGRALALAFVAAGGTLLANEAVVRLEERDGKVCGAQTPFGHYTADAVLLAAGAWTRLLDADVAIAPVKGQMIALADPAGRVPDGPVVWGSGVYAVPRRGLLLVGATVQEVGFDTSLDAGAATGLRARAEALMPALRGWTLAGHWAGLRPRSRDGLPLLGELKPGLFVAGGQYRNGILFAPAIADGMAARLLGTGSLPQAFDPRRFRKAAA